MTDSTEMTEEQKLEVLKTKAKTLGIRIRGNLSSDTLLKAIQEKSAELEAKTEQVATPANDRLATQKRYAEVRKEALALVRVQISCMNPNKKEWAGDFYAVGNKAVGTIKKYIPFHPESHPDGYHIPKMLLESLKGYQYQAFKTIKHANGEKTKKGVLNKEFAITVLPPLTKEELARLAKMQLAKGGLEA